MSINREKLNAKFESEFKRLNKEQAHAVETLEGPVMVIAGPGTGKTQILASRIGKILLDTDAAPDNILCLTYTDAGVVAMRRRLQEMIGPEAYAVNIYTFHAFCNDVIQENLSLFEKDSLDPISELDRTTLLKELVRQFPKGHPLKRYRGDHEAEITNLKWLFSAMKREGWTPEHINQRIDEYVKDLPFRKEFIYQKKTKQFNAGDLKQHLIDDELLKMERLRAAANEFDKFQRMMRSKGWYDFDDMINWVIHAFETHPNLLARYQEQFLYMLVDEYQDTSGTQEKLIDLLSNFWENPNVFVVGDDDQSIYRFQGASEKNMTHFRCKYQDSLETVMLTRNYRSTQNILDLSISLIERNRSRLVNDWSGLSKDLEASNPSMSHSVQTPIIREFGSQREEMAGVCMQIKELVDKGVPPGEIGVIYKENKYGEELSSYLKWLGVPYYTKRHLNIFTLPIARQILLICEWIAAEHDTPYSGDEMLFKILHFSWFGIAPLEIAKLSVQVSQTQFETNPKSLRLLLHEKSVAPPRDLFSPSFPEPLKKASAMLEKLVAAVPNMTLQQLFEKIILEAGILNHVMGSPDKISLMKIITGLFDFIKDETRRQPSMDLAKWIETIETMQKEDIELPLAEINGNERGVNLMTAHGAKGLEFEWIFLMGCSAKLWEKKRKVAGKYSLPDTLTKNPDDEVENKGGEIAGTTLSPKEASLEELRRLFYVALTRAKRHLQVSYSRMNNDGKPTEPSQFIAELKEAGPFLAKEGIVSEEDMLKFQALPFGRKLAPQLKQVEDDFIRPLIEKFVMNVTALNNFLDCPLNFYFNSLLRIPAGRSEAAVFGQAVHYALERLFSKMKDNKNIFHGAEVFLDDFEWYMRRHRENFTREQFDRRLEYGHEILPAYYHHSLESWNKIVSLEMSVRSILSNGVPIKGKIDKMEFDRNFVNVVDYKTGDFDKAKKVKKHFHPPSEDVPNGGNYWRQAVFYKLLVDNFKGKNWQVVSTEFDFIEPDKKKAYHKLKIEMNPEDLTAVSAQIKEVWDRIQAHDFYKGCGKATCHYCNFVKDNQLYISLTELKDENGEIEEDLGDS